jgi:GT2 family glycosyltransferase
MKLSAGIAIVAHNSADCIALCLRAALAHAPQVLVVDNASQDQTCEIVRGFPGVHLLANDSNRGFAGAVNQAFGALASDLILVLNPDTELLGGFEELVRACSEPGVAAAAGKLVDETGELQPRYRVRRFPTPAALALEALGFNALFPRNPVNRRYRCADFDPNQPADVEQPAGAFLMLRRNVWEILGGMDEAFYPVFFEEVDFLKRAAERGFRVRYVPGAVARHVGGHSLRQLPQPALNLYWYGNLLRYGSKHFRRPARTGLCLAVALGAAARMAAAVLRVRNVEPVLVHNGVIRLAGKALLRNRGLSTGRGSAAMGSAG